MAIVQLAFTSTPAGGKWTVPSGVTSVNVLVVAGGGAGGYKLGEGHFYGAGGSGGIVFYPNYSVEPGAEITVTIGGGGNPKVTSPYDGGSGANSVFGTLTAIGGGGGGAYGSTSVNSGKSGGSGGGSGGTVTSGTYVGGSATQPGQGGNSGTPYGKGNNGGTSLGGGINSRIGAEGGGAGAVGSNYNGNGKGGDGLKEITISDITYNFADIFGQSYGIDNDSDGNRWFAGGGGYSGGGKGGGGGNGGSGTANTGGGGGPGGGGGSGIVLVQYEIVSGLNMQVKIGSAWKNVSSAQVKIGNNWKNVSGVQIKIGNNWKNV